MIPSKQQQNQPDNNQPTLPFQRTAFSIRNLLS